MGLFDAIGSVIGAGMAASSARDQISAQKIFAQKGIQWRVADAEKAGIHPIYALGAQTHQFSPVSVPDYAAVGSQLGQNLDSAIAKKFTDEGKANTVMQALAVERAGLENDKLRSEIRAINGAGSVPSLPSPTDQALIPGQGDSRAGVRITPNEVIASQAAAPHAAAGAVTDIQYARTPTGFTIVPGQSKNAIEDMVVPETQWSLRNTHINPPKHTPPNSWLPKGHEWEWQPHKQEWQAVPIGRPSFFDTFKRR